MKIRFKKVAVAALTIIGLMGNSLATHAYVHNNYPFSSVGSLKFYAASDLNYDFTSIMEEYTKKWNGIAGVRLSRTNDPSSCNIYQSFYNSDNGTYGVCDPVTSGYKKITYYRSFLGTTTSNRQETVVHEVGHALGLAHTQKSNDSIAVMRQYGFNGKAYLLSDDINGLNALYK
ncbi:MAG: matrixin family metalloprotease [Clostridium argentinense]|uniref:Matrixin family metalloprotease n=1 Tax=Clostridium faecium TaxID=2762223 RepID=A0ABR8YQ46_9CLOT|nr:MULTISPECIES: matrixin family metalloprotease [Clostridium]MBD8046382.1 matrixin family metalloprotease [Clostridium faecium]MBS5824924.1 matrixin family metalloprotease [Clostridium argentinense]MDU1349379.1 matrixin family metalloprotease [Clostridium argentinense]